ncbi:hypothetical protein TIFTF001_023148 [Ficus carica]|uniref:Uncharacterized protein n=1 Tax=Ficus carica TaxID=3494 RepID=A0AA88DK46_FICCA|nr:hypothetical protein TIFTF001_023148 [Ficus carica]
MTKYSLFKKMAGNLGRRISATIVTGPIEWSSRKSNDQYPGLASVDVAVTIASNLCRRLLLLVVVNQNCDFTKAETEIGLRFREALAIFFDYFEIRSSKIAEALTRDINRRP